MRDTAVPGGEALIGEHARSIAAGAVAAALAFAIAVDFFDVRVADLAVPIWYEGDSLFSLALAKGLLDHGGILHNPDVGAPHGLDLHDFPLPYGMHLVALRAIGMLTDEPGMAVNSLWLLGFPAIAACAFAALRMLDLPRLESAAAAVLYCFLPYHLARGEKHLFLSMYYLVPLACAVALRLYRDGARKRLWPAVLALALGASGVYYAVFGCFFFAVAGALGSLRARSATPLGAAALLVALVGASVAAGVAPNLLYWRENGPNPAALERLPVEAELYGLKIAPMLLPVAPHAIPSWAETRNRYEARTPQRNESGFATLGVVTGAGFVLLLGWALAALALRERHVLLDGLAALNLAGVLLATTSGIGALVALFGLPQIRAYNRISIWLGFFALAALVAVAQPLHDRLARRRATAVIGAALLALLLSLALADVLSPGFRPGRKAVGARFAIDRAFVTAAEAALPARTAVFQLPHVAYPEAVPPERMLVYDSLRPYLHSRTLRWSHGAMKGRPEAVAIDTLAMQPAAALPDELVAAGYGALMVDRFGYTPEQEAALRTELEARLGTPIVNSDDDRWLLYRLQPSANPS